MSKGSVDAQSDEEEVLVLVEFSGVIDDEFLLKDKSECKILGLHTNEPIFQLDDHIFTGEYEDTIGSAVLFSEKSNKDEDKMSLECICDKKLNMKRAFLKEKETEKPIETSDSTADGNS